MWCPHCCCVFLHFSDLHNRVRMRPKGSNSSFKSFKGLFAKKKGWLAMKLSKRVSLAAPGNVSLRSTKPTFCRVANFFRCSETKVSPWERFVDAGKPNAACIPLKQPGHMPLKNASWHYFQRRDREGGSQRNSHGTIGPTNGTQRLDTCGAGAVRRVPKWFCMKLSKPSIHHRIGKPYNGGCPGLLYQSLSRRSCHLYLDRWMDNISKTHHITWSWSFMLCARCFT